MTGIFDRLFKLVFHHVIGDIRVRVHAPSYDVIELLECVAATVISTQRKTGHDHACKTQNKLNAERDIE